MLSHRTHLRQASLQKRKNPPPKESTQKEEEENDSSVPLQQPSADFFRVERKKRLKVSEVKEKAKKNQIVCEDLLPQPPFLLVIVAPRKSGKTNLLLDSLLDEHKYCNKFDVIIIWSRTYHHDAKWKNIQLPEGSVFTVFSEEEADTIMRMAEHVAKTKVVNALFIFDDMITEGIMSSRKMGTIESIAVRGRHANVSIIIISQQYMALSPPVRNNATNTVFFRIRNGDELDKISRENRESLSVAQFMELYNFATNEPFCFLHVNNQQSDPSKRFWKNWDIALPLNGLQATANPPEGKESGQKEATKEVDKRPKDEPSGGEQS